ncbi:MAG: helix-turn-helix domain containing protein [Clostridiales bacterium]|nr:helix-turn-helix domain containing protein [Clostridiales bacterium]
MTEGLSKLEKDIYGAICRRDGIKASEIALQLGVKRHEVNACLFSSALMREFCYRDEDARWYGMIRHRRPYDALYDFSGWYGTVREFLLLDEENFMTELTEGCQRIARSLNDARGVIHSFRDCREVMISLSDDLREMSGEPFEDWEIAFEVRFNRARYIRVYADVLLICNGHVFSLEFKMKDKVLEEDLEQSVKYVPYLQIIFGEDMKITPALVLTGAEGIFEHKDISCGEGRMNGIICSRDMLFNVLDEQLMFLIQ